MTFPSFTHRYVDIQFGRHFKDHLFAPFPFTDKKVNPQKISYLGLVYADNN